MKTKSLETLATAFALLVLSLLPVISMRAGTITVVSLPANNTDQAVGISTAQSYLCAFDFGNYSTPAGFNINGVLFTHFSAPVANNFTNIAYVVDTNYGGAITLTSGPNSPGVIYGTNNLAAANDTPSGQADGNTELMLEDIIYPGGGNNDSTNDYIIANFTGLTPGDSYTLCFYYRQWASGEASPRLVNVSFNGDGTNTPYSGNPLNIDAGGANCIEYNFIAASTNVLAAFTNAGTYFNDPPMTYGATLVNNSIQTPAYISSQPGAYLTNGAVQFSVTAGGTPPLYYQWYYNTVSNYTGATMETDGGGVTGSTSNVLTVNNNLNDYYFVVVTNDVAPYSATSEVVQVASQLTVTSAGVPIWNPTNSETNVVITFSDVLNPATATDTANYSLSPGGGIISAVMGGSNEVVLTTSTLNPLTSYTLQIQNVEDQFGIPMSPSPTNLAVGVYPATVALWVKASTITGADLDGSGGVDAWPDLSGNGNNFAGLGSLPYDPLLATNALGQQVVRFTATNETVMYASPSGTLDNFTNNMSILAVMSFASTLAAADGSSNGFIVGKDGVSGSVAAPYECYVLNDSQGQRLYRGNGTSYGQFTATNVPSIGVPQILEVTESGNVISDYLNGIPSGTGPLNNSFLESESVDAGQPVFIGTRGDDNGRLTGDILELMIVGQALSAYDCAAMQNYFATEYGLPATGSDSAPAITQEPLASTNLNQGLTLTVPAAADGYPAPAYQWYETNLTAQTGYALPGETGPSLVINDVQTNDNYYLEATNAWGAAMSSIVVVTINSGLFAQLPQTATASEGQSYPLTVTTTGSVTPVYYQWYQGMPPNGTPIANATNAIYNAIAALGSTYYYCGVSNAANGYTYTNAGPVDLIGAIVNLTWRGLAPGDPGNWDITASTNWFNTITLANSPFYIGAAVTFDDTGLTNVVNVPSTLVSGPVTISANNTNYAFVGPGGISGTNGLTVSGSATTTIQTTNSYTGVTTFGGGIVSVPILTIGGSNSPIGAASAGSTNIVFNGGQLQYTGPSVSINRGLTLNANGGTLAVSSATTILTNNGVITGSGNLTVSGGGVLALSGANSYGATTVNSGATLAVGGGGTLGIGGITNNGTLYFLSGVNMVMTNITGSGIVTNASGSTLWLGGSNSFTGNINVGTTDTAPGTVYITNTYALNGTSQLRLAGGISSSTTPVVYLANNSATPNTTSINIPASVGLLEVGANGANCRPQLATWNGGTDYWNGPITLAGDGSVSEDAYLAPNTNGSLLNPPSGTLVINGNITAPLGSKFLGAFQLAGSVGSYGIINGTFTLNTNVLVEYGNNAGTWRINSSGNSCGFQFVSSGVVQLGVNNALPENAPFRFGNCAMDLNGYNQEVFWLTNAAGGTDGLITNSNPNTLSTLTYDSPGLFVYSVSGNGTSFANGSFDQFNGGIGGYLALNVAGTAGGGVLQLGTTTANSSLLTYTGPTTISGGSTLTLGGVSTIPNTPSITLAGGTTLNVASLRNTNSVNLFTNILLLGASQTLSNSSSTATLTGNFYAAGTVSLTYASGTPSFTVTGGQLTLLSTTGFNVNNTGPALVAGSYELIGNGTAGSVAGTVPSVTVGGGGIAAHSAASLSISNSDLYLVVTPAINANPTNIVFSASNNQLTLSWPTDHTGWTLQAQTNSVSVGINNNWISVSGSTATNQVIIPINLTNGCVFYRLIYNP
ncbi:MAG TPA: hypothetical protein VMF08_20045 [Candidatus Sulfotelmatobacter sp.]|nr:hypothetical protein [Candidatus Sulfotelmatobacter sp.]